MLAPFWLEIWQTYTIILQGSEKHADNRISSEVCLVPIIFIVSVNFHFRICKPRLTVSP